MKATEISERETGRTGSGIRCVTPDGHKGYAARNGIWIECF
jgi:hypothetical protein